ncbi:sporulation-specific diadenylate cyclase CdaS [Falsibacillus pallidus]|uniref:sporulation-specific diadenylate cyclase CdaS n=1 Tax=Falsibacillus pallidus TaxID=493781 RepID=UPI003D969CDF
MGTSNCDFSPMKIEIAAIISNIRKELEDSESILAGESTGFLEKLEKIREKFMLMESMASSFYLNCYLSSYTNLYNELSSSVQRLSEIRHGALIVIERKDSVDQYIQKGTPIDATCTPALLEAIFYPGNPLHDGAALIKGNHIISAANILPLNTITIKNKKLGTRHRSAIGLSEVCDALIMVVSEETGRISFALNGQLYPIAYQEKGEGK